MTPEEAFFLQMMLERKQAGEVQTQAKPDTSFDLQKIIDAYAGKSAGKEAVTAAAPSVSSFGGIPASQPVASSVNGGTVLANQTVAPMSPTGMSTAPAGMGLEAGFATYGIPAAAIATTALAGKAGYNMLKGKSDNSIPGKFGRASLGIATGGSSEAVNRILNGTKSGDQKGRDIYRGNFQKSGIADSDYNVSLYDGTKFNIGLDGGTKYTNVDGKSRNAYDVDFSNALAKDSIPTVSKIINSLNPEYSEKQKSDAVGQIINAVTSNAKTREDVDYNINNIFGPTGNENVPSYMYEGKPKPQSSAIPKTNGTLTANSGQVDPKFRTLPSFSPEISPIPSAKEQLEKLRATPYIRKVK